MEPLVKGRKIAQRYTLLASLHTSDYAQIWLAQDDALKSRVAIKMAHSQNELAAKLLRNEFDMNSQCVHAGIVRAFELHDEEELLFIAMEYLSGGDFLSLMGRPLAQFISPMMQIAEALHHVHQQGIVHRDVKLSNFAIDGRGHARLLDFGVASKRGEQGLRSGGSPRSMSPQQTAGEPPEPADDLYAFGVALYRLLRNDWPQQEDSLPAPGSLGELISRLMHPDPQQRPADMAQVAEQLRLALAEQSNVTLPPDEFEFNAEDEEHINVIELDTVTAAPATASQSNTRRSRWLLPWLIMYGAIAAIALFYFMPKLASDGDAAKVAGVTDATATTAETSAAKSTALKNRDDVEPWQLAQEAKLRKDAEATLEQLLDKQFYLEDKQAPIWAGDEFAHIKEHAINGDKMFRQKNYTEALAFYQKGKEVADKLALRADTILPDTLDSAKLALESADSATALGAYQLALQINPNSSRASAGIKRAENLGEVLELVAKGEALEQDGNSTAALDAYKQASALDKKWAAASAGIKRIQTQQANRAYSTHMSAGFNAMEAGDFAEAHSAFERAKRISPRSAEVKDAFAQLETAIRLQDISNVQSRAQSLEQQGDWRGAEREYQSILKKDGSLQSARDALRRVQTRAAAEEELAQLLANPVRLANDSVYRQAESVLQSVQPYLSDPDIAAQSNKLKSLMADSRVPVSVVIKSDNKTEVLVYRVGQLGAFNIERINLRPGEYTAVGTRSGFRDVRVEFIIAPGQSGVQIEVVCREAI